MTAKSAERLLLMGAATQYRILGGCERRAAPYVSAAFANIGPGELRAAP